MSEILKIFLENEKAIRRFLARQNRVSGPELDDQVQETFLRSFAAERKSAIDEPRAYLFQVARNIVLERRRKKQRRPELWLEDSVGADLIVDERHIGAEDELDGRRKLAALTRAVAALPPQCRRAFLMRRIDGLSYKEIAARMNITVSAVEKHVALGLFKCNASLRARGYAPSEFGAAGNEARDAAPGDGAKAKVAAPRAANEKKAQDPE